MISLITLYTLIFDTIIILLLLHYITYQYISISPCNALLNLYYIIYFYIIIDILFIYYTYITITIIYYIININLINILPNTHID